MNTTLKTELKVACKDNLWAHCTALGDTMRRLSEMEREYKRMSEALLAERLRVRELENAAKPMTDMSSIVTTAYQRMIDSVPRPPQLSGCPNCGSERRSTRGLKRDDIDAGLWVCAVCYTRYEEMK